MDTTKPGIDNGGTSARRIITKFKKEEDAL